MNQSFISGSKSAGVLKSRKASSSVRSLPFSSMLRKSKPDIKIVVPQAGVSSLKSPVHSPICSGKNKGESSPLSRLLSSSIIVLPPPSVRISVAILSNWGNEKFISCLHIDFLDKSNNTIQVTSATMITNQKHSSIDLISDPMNTNTVWSEAWPPDPPKSIITLVFQVSCEADCKSIRVWPYTADPSQNIKNVVVSVESQVVYHGEFPYDFVRIIPFKNAGEEVVSEPILTEIAHIIKPKDGPIPVQFYASTISIVPLSSYNSEKKFGLNQILLFDRDGIKIESSHEGMCVQGFEIDDHMDVIELLRDYPKTQHDFIESLPFTVPGILSPLARIEIKFAEPQSIGAIAVLNSIQGSNGEVPTTKNLSIQLDSKKVWTGRIKLRSTRNPSELRNSSFIWLVDDKDYQKKVMSSFPTRTNQGK